MNPRQTHSIRTRTRQNNPSGAEVRRKGCIETSPNARPRSRAAAHWGGVALEDYAVPTDVVPQHEHVENVVHVVREGNVRYEVLTGGKMLRFCARPGTTFVLPQDTIDEIRWSGSTRCLAAALHLRLLANALEETAHGRAVDLTERWSLTDSNVVSVLLAMRIDLAAGSPAERLHGESFADGLATYVPKRYAAKRRVPKLCRGGLPRHRLKRVLKYINENLPGDLALAQLAAVAGMSPHYFAELFRQSTGSAPHQYVLLRRIDLAKQRLRDPARSVTEAGLDAGFQNSSHFARVFRKLVGISPSAFRSRGCWARPATASAD